MNLFTCHLCKQTFEKGWSDERALEELHENFGPELTAQDCETICEDCYQWFMRWLNAQLKH